MPIQVLVSRGMVDKVIGNPDGPTYCEIVVGSVGSMCLDDITFLKPISVLASMGHKVCVMVDSSRLVARGVERAAAAQRSREVLSQAEAIIRRAAPDGQIAMVETLQEMEKVGLLEFSAMYGRTPWKELSKVVGSTYDVFEWLITIRNFVWINQSMGFRVALRRPRFKGLCLDFDQFGLAEGGFVCLKSLVVEPPNEIYLSSSHTPVLDFYQYWMNLDDAEAGRMLPWLTELPPQEIKEIELAYAKNPQKRYPQRILANNMTRFVHGNEMAERAMAYSNLLFGGSGIKSMDEPTLEWVSKLLPHENLAPSMPILLSKLLCKIGLCFSNAEAKRIISQGGISMNDIPYDEDVLVDRGDLRFGKYAVILRGKKTYRVAVFEGA